MNAMLHQQLEKKARSFIKVLQAHSLTRKKVENYRKGRIRCLAVEKLHKWKQITQQKKIESKRAQFVIEGIDIDQCVENQWIIMGMKKWWYFEKLR